MNECEQKRAERAERYRELAEKNEQLANQQNQAGWDKLHQIPFGQPILIGHHSERRHRNHIKRVDAHFAKSKEASDKADYYRNRAAAAESNRAIFADDPEATTKIEDRVKKLEERQKLMVAANKLVKKGDREGLLDLGFTEKTVDECLKGDFCGRKGFPAYMLQNNPANIRRLKLRLGHLEKAATESTTEETLKDGIRMADNVEENRLQIFFPSIPAPEIRQSLKQNGFRWSPSNKAWQRHRSTRAKWLAQTMFGEPVKEDGV